MKKLLNSAYENIKNNIKYSKEYPSYLYSINVNEKLFKDLIKQTTFIDKDGKSSSMVSTAIEDVDFVYYFSKSYDLQDDFTKMYIKALDHGNTLEKVINTKFAETIYGNSIKNDLTNIDVLFTILEGIFGLDTIVMFLNQNDKKILEDRLCTIMGSNDLEIVSSFDKLINRVYNETWNLSSYEEIQNVIDNYKVNLNSYATPGLIKQIDEIEKDPNGNFSSISLLQKRLNKILAVNNKKM